MLFRKGAAAVAIIAACAAVATAARAEVDPRYVEVLNKDAPRGADHPLVGRYEGSNLLAQTTKAFEEITLPTAAAVGKTYESTKHFDATTTLRGKVTRTIYVTPTGRSSLEVFTNYADKVAAAGFAPVFECAREACGESFPELKYNWQRKETQVSGEGYEHTRKLIIEAVFDGVADVRYALYKKASPEGDSYVAIYAALNQGGSFGTFSALLNDRAAVLVEVVEPRAMDRRMVVVNAEEIGGKLATEGRAVFYGIQFDFDKADIKPESEPQLAEMAKFLAANPQTRVFIVGHTDTKGALDYNLGLSGRRAEAVVKTLAGKYGIAPARLTARGLGPLAPLATNRSDEGRAKNRRVELVEQ